MYEEVVNSTSNRARQLEVIQVTSDNVFAELGCVSGDLNKQIAPG